MTLKPRELQVVGLVAAGLPIKVIAEDMGIGKQTVNRYIQNAAEKLGLPVHMRRAIALTRWYIANVKKEKE